MGKGSSVRFYDARKTFRCFSDLLEIPFVWVTGCDVLVKGQHKQFAEAAEEHLLWKEVREEAG